MQSNGRMLKNDNLNSFAGRLKIERKRLNLTQVELARQLGVSVKTISNYETSKGQSPFFKMIQAGIDVNYMITGVRMSPGCLAELRKGLENGDDWRPSKEFVIEMVNQYLKLL